VEFPATELIYSRRTDFHNIEVSQNTELRLLRTDQIAVQSALRRNKPEQLVLPYMQAMIAALLFQPSPQQVLLFGLGGGDIVRQLHFQLPNSQITAVEIDPAIVEVSRDYFELPDSDKLTIKIDDAENFLHQDIQHYEMMLIDIYGGIEIPALLQKPDFYQHCHQQLEDNGMLVLNLLTSDAEKFRFILWLIRQQFDHSTLCLTVPGYNNIIIFAFKKRPTELNQPALLHKAEQLKQQYGLELGEWARQLFSSNPTAGGELIF